MDPEDFIQAYENALGTQDWNNIEPLLSESASVTFSDGSVHLGKKNVQIAFERNFNTIKNEKYRIENIRWLRRENNFAVYVFDFHWTGLINGASVSGSGIGTSVLVKEDNSWKLLTEHLGKKSF